MSNLDEIAQTLTNQFGDAEKKIDGLKKMKGQQRFLQANKYKRQLERIKTLLETYDFSIKDSEEDNLGVHESQYKEMSVKLESLNRELEYAKNEKADQDELFKHRNKNGGDERGENSRQKMIQKGHDIQDQGMEALDRVLKQGYQMQDMANEINVQLDRQINQLDSIYDNMKDMNTTMKRAQVHLRYFARQVYTDRLMICLIIFIILAIIAIIILKIIGKTPQVSVDNIK